MVVAVAVDESPVGHDLKHLGYLSLEPLKDRRKNRG
jgi:hypothetical protein